MSRHHSSESGDSFVPKDLDLQLLDGAQAFLRCLQGDHAPSDGEKQAWKRFYDGYNPLLESFVGACGLTGMDAEDCTQDAWLEIMKTLPGFVSDGTQRGICCWLHTIVHTKAV